MCFSRGRIPGSARGVEELIIKDIITLSEEERHLHQEDRGNEGVVQDKAQRERTSQFGKIVFSVSYL